MPKYPRRPKRESPGTCSEETPEAGGQQNEGKVGRADQSRP